eukprot:2516935-Lingulodinium_polyedra.AAC.1
MLAARSSARPRARAASSPRLHKQAGESGETQSATRSDGASTLVNLRAERRRAKRGHRSVGPRSPRSCTPVGSGRRQGRDPTPTN